MQLNNERVNNELKEETKRYLETNENTMTPNLCNKKTAKAVITQKSSKQAYLPQATKNF